MHSSALECTHAVRATLYRPSDQTQSDAIRCHPMQSRPQGCLMRDAIRRNQTPSDAIRCHQMQSRPPGYLMREAIRCNQGNQGP